MKERQYMQNKENRRVLIDPILLVLKSRRVIIALVSLIAECFSACCAIT